MKYKDRQGNLIIKEDGNVIGNKEVTVEKSVDKAGLFTMYFRYIKDIIGFRI